MKLLEKLKTDRQDLISKLCDNIDSLERIAFEQQAEIERLKTKLDTQETFCKRIHDESIKGFAEWLKEKGNMSKDGLIVVDYQIDDLVKKMVGD